MGTGGKFCYLEHSVLSKISCASKQEEENASNSPGIVSLVLVSMQRSGAIGIQHGAWRGTTGSLVILSGWGWGSGCLTLFHSFPLLWEFWHLHSCVFSSNESWVIWMTDWTQVFACVSVLWLRIASFMGNWEWISGDPSYIPSYILRRHEMEVPRQTGVAL